GGRLGVRVAAPRGFRGLGLLRRLLDPLLARKAPAVSILSGRAAGADAMGEAYAVDRGYNVLRFEARWDLFGKSAGPLRNQQMAEADDALVAFWNGRSRGTADMIARAKARGLALP